MRSVMHNSEWFHADDSVRGACCDARAFPWVGNLVRETIRQNRAQVTAEVGHALESEAGVHESAVKCVCGDVARAGVMVTVYVSCGLCA